MFLPALAIYKAFHDVAQNNNKTVLNDESRSERIPRGWLRG
jgi:hypothetical protein